MAKAKCTAKQRIPAAGYLRKSTKGEDADGKERQEKSIPQQKREIEQLAKQHGYTIIRWYADPGISGWKRGAKRPDFSKMLTDARDRGDFQAVVCDNIDRFSRASVDEVQSDALELKRAGVRYILTAAQGVFDLGRSGHDIGEIMRFVVAAWSSHEYSRQLARRIALARRNAAKEGKRTGGPAPYAMANDGNGGLTHGDPKEIKVVRWIFDEFVNQHRSLTSIAKTLNEQGTPAPRGGCWYTMTIRDLLRQAAYRGDFVFNKESGGQFFRIDDKQEVVESEGDGVLRRNGDGGLFKREGAYDPLVPPAVFDKAQRKLDSFREQNRKPRNGGFALTGILVCDHCGRRLAGAIHGNHAVYRCKTNSTHGTGCGHYQIREDRILPYILQTLGEEIDDLTRLHTAVPAQLLAPAAARNGRREDLEEEVAALRAKIDRAEENLLFCDDARTRQSLDAKVSKMRDELDSINADLATADADADAPDYTAEDVAALTAWWDAFCKDALCVPLPADRHAAAHDDLPNLAAYTAAMDHGCGSGKLADRRAVNEALAALGAEVRLRWRTEDRKCKKRHFLARGRLRLGQRQGEIATSVKYGSA